MLPFLKLSDLKGAELQLLRSELNAEEKNTRMMQILSSKQWWITYKRQLDARRLLDKERVQYGLPPSPDPYPRHPSDLVEEVERLVEEQMKAKYKKYTR